MDLSSAKRPMPPAVKPSKYIRIFTRAQPRLIPPRATRKPAPHFRFGQRIFLASGHQSNLPFPHTPDFFTPSHSTLLLVTLYLGPGTRDIFLRSVEFQFGAVYANNRNAMSRKAAKIAKEKKRPWRPLRLCVRKGCLFPNL